MSGDLRKGRGGWLFADAIVTDEGYLGAAGY
jgi:hypothetical protein